MNSSATKHNNHNLISIPNNLPPAPLGILLPHPTTRLNILRGHIGVLQLYPAWKAQLSVFVILLCIIYGKYDICVMCKLVPLPLPLFLHPAAIILPASYSLPFADGFPSTWNKKIMAPPLSDICWSRPNWVSCGIFVEICDTHYTWSIYLSI
jgi:hypothetical protein